MKNTAYFFITTIAIVVTLIFGQDLIIPFIFALILWFLVRKTRHVFDQVKFIKRYVPSWFKNLFISFIMVIILGFISKILLSNISSLTNSYAAYQGNVDLIINQANDLFKINIIEAAKAHSNEFEFGMILSAIFSSLTNLLSNAFIIIIYALFIFLEEVNFNAKLTAVVAKKEQYEQLSDILEKIEKSIASYIGLKTLISVIAGVASFVILSIIGIDAPVFWAFLIFILNFIPVIGSLVGTLFPAIYCLLQFGNFMPSILVLLFVGGILVLIGNLLEPKLMGNSLNISSFVTIFALSFWGSIWGITGMILSIPITVILVIIFSHFEKTKSIAIMLSEKGKIE